ncbi:MAG: hypothetical protein R3B98_00725 [Hyphomonas sp.]
MTDAKPPRGLDFLSGAFGLGAIYAIFALFALFAMAHYAFIGAFSAAVVWWWAKRRKWPGNWAYRKVWYAALWGLLAYMIPTWIIDLVFHTYHSLFGVMALIDQHACLYNCDAPNPYNSIRIWDIGSYYAFAAPGLMGWIRYALLQIPGIVAGVAGTMAMMQEQASHPGGRRRVLGTSLFFIGFEIIVGIPWFISFVFFFIHNDQGL